MLVAAVQFSAGPEPAHNLAAAIDATRAAATAGARLVVLPEKWLAIGNASVLDPVAEPLGGPLTTTLAALAAELRIDLVAGSITERRRDGRLHNTSLHYRSDGSLAAIYRKVHLFDADIDGHRYRESDAETAGHQPVISPLVRHPDYTLGLSICFDLRFPELFRTLADAGANIITLPSAFTEATTRAHWETLVRARAIELGAYVIAANQCGTHADGTRSGGHSLIVGPWGEILATADDHHPETITAELDPAAITAAHTALPISTLRRPDAYRRHADDGLAD